MRGCSVSGCGEKHIARGYCQNHYRVFMRHGTPTPTKKPRKVHTATGGYQFVTIDRKTTYIHIQVAERVLGKPLPTGAEIHHINGDPQDNRPANLVICPNHEYHMLLHQRERALDACGNADWRPCRMCGHHDDPQTMRPSRKQFYHRECAAELSRRRRARIKEAV